MMPKNINKKILEEVAIECSDIIATKTSPKGVTKGQFFNYYLVFENVGDKTAIVTSVTDYLPKEFKFISHEGNSEIMKKPNIVVCLKRENRITTLLENEYSVSLIENKLIITNVFDSMDIPPGGKLQITISGRT